MAALQVAELSFEAIAALRPLMMRIKRSDRALADQLTRAATSVALNIAEADGLEAGNRRARFFHGVGQREGVARGAQGGGVLALHHARRGVSCIELAPPHHRHVVEAHALGAGGGGPED